MERSRQEVRTKYRFSHLPGSVNNLRGFSLIEFQVGILISAILVLTIGVLSSMAQSSYAKISKEETVFNDAAYAFKLMQNKIRSSTSMSVKGNPTNPPWKSSQLLFRYSQVVGGIETFPEGAFGLYQANGSTTVDLVYMPDTSKSAKEVLMSLKAGQTFSFTLSNITTQSLTVQLSGTKSGIPFDISNVVLRRTL